MQHCQAHPLGEILSGCLAFIRPLDLAFGFHSLRIDLRGQLTRKKAQQVTTHPWHPGDGTATDVWGAGLRIPMQLGSPLTHFSPLASRPHSVSAFSLEAMDHFPPTTEWQNVLVPLFIQYCLLWNLIISFPTSYTAPVKC